MSHRTEDVDFPRVLVVGAAPIGAATGTGITLGNLFEGWPRDRLAQVYTMDVVPPADACGRQFQVDPRSAPIDHVARRLLSGGDRALLRGAPPIAAVPSPGGRRSPRAGLHAELRAVADLSLFRVSGRLREWVRDFHPDLVYSPLGSVRIMRLAGRLAQRCGVPLVPHFMDDWPSTLYSTGELLGRARGAVRSSLRTVIRLSEGGICISRPMADEYERRYGRPFAAFVNCVDAAAFADPDSPSRASRASSGLDLVYVGGLHLDRWRSLRQLGVALESLGSTDAPLLTIHAPEADLDRYRDSFAGCSAVRLARSLRGHEVPGILARADVLVHIESFRAEIQQYTRFSLSTKLPQYLAAGRPVLGYGPGELASMLHIRAAEAGIVVGVDDHALLATRLAELCGDAALRRRLARNGYAYARQHHRKEEVAARFAGYLRSMTAARGGPRGVRVGAAR
ncbi:hypothetical protein GCM10022225_18080 [Plantactinospora mayteni]|uniref:Glycosyltransferase subfamily 4-like N-terminal domain-containing protein n=1 Tax=Plantactinospora mayteni TaxID=566021 RepID=A0ABQ4EGM6_9ACTN|nr:glycosyltransferase [Plantactinospora mayteni]GIG93881.1 hypothetical protein Pma05_04540 [Plantactinospora mayteni]